MLDRAGLCFTSRLGQAVFDNEDCVSNNPELDPHAALMIERIEWFEENRLACDIDTDRTELDILNDPSRSAEFAQRRELDIQPSEWPQNFRNSYACDGYIGSKTALYSAPNESARVLGEIHEGARIYFRYRQILQNQTLEFAETFNKNNLEFPDTHAWQFVSVKNVDAAEETRGWVYTPLWWMDNRSDSNKTCTRMIYGWVEYDLKFRGLSYAQRPF